MKDQVRKYFTTVSKAVDVEQGIFEAMITTEAIDRQGDIVRATGAQLENYMKNPVVLWAHDYDEPPVAKCIGIEIMPGVGIKATFQFPAPGVNPEADTVRQLWTGGFLNATSIGFIPLACKPVDEKADERYYWGPWDYVSWEMLEFSIVPVPANQEALRLALRSLTRPETKRGRVLSAANENKLRQARDAIDAVLTQIAEEEPQQEQESDSTTKGTNEETQSESDPGSGQDAQSPVTEPEQAESNIDPTPNDLDETALAALSDFINAMHGA